MTDSGKIFSKSRFNNAMGTVVMIMSRLQQIGAWIGIIGGGIAFFFFSMYAEDFFR